MSLGRLRRRPWNRPPRFAGPAPLASPAIVAGVPAFTRKQDAPCCVAATDSAGRLPVGFCGPDCMRRTERDAWLHWREQGPS